MSGQCGRLKCCLNYELDTYLDALQGFPENADMLQVARGTATLIKKDIFRNLMWYVLPDSSNQYPLTIERVNKIRSLNQQNIIPEELEAVDVTSSKPKEVEPEFVDVVGHITLKSLEKSDKKRNQKGRDQRQSQQQRSGNAPSKINKPLLKGSNPQQRPPEQKGPVQQRRQPQRPKPNNDQKGNNNQRPNRPQRPPGNNDQNKPQ